MFVRSPVRCVFSTRNLSTIHLIYLIIGPRRAAIALAALSGDAQCIIFSQLCNVLDPGVAVAFGSASSELWALTPALLQQLRADYEVATTLCRKMGLQLQGAARCTVVRVKLA